LRRIGLDLALRIILASLIFMPLFSCTGKRPTNVGIRVSSIAQLRIERCSSVFFGFVDDLELHLCPSQNLIAVRSASRLGHSDFGVNRKRIENLRGLLRKRGALR
jgi:uncharacterized protein (DUF1499 family)